MVFSVGVSRCRVEAVKLNCWDRNLGCDDMVKMGRRKGRRCGIQIKRGDVRREFKVKGWAQRREKSGSRERQCGIGLVLCWSFLATKASRSAKCPGSLGLVRLVRLVPAQMRRCLDASLPTTARCPLPRDGYGGPQRGKSVKRGRASNDKGRPPSSSQAQGRGREREGSAACCGP